MLSENDRPITNGRERVQRTVVPLLSFLAHLQSLNTVLGCCTRIMSCFSKARWAVVLHMGGQCVILPLSSDPVWEDREKGCPCHGICHKGRCTPRSWYSYGLVRATISNQDHTVQLLLHWGCRQLSLQGFFCVLASSFLFAGRRWE